MPLILLDAALLLPDGAALAADADRATAPGRFAWLAGSALTVVQTTTERYSLAGTATAPQRAALAAAAQLSEELLSRGVMFGFAALWLRSRLEEAGLGDAAAYEGGPPVWDVARWAGAGAIVGAAGLRFSHRAAELVAALQAARRAAEAAAAAAGGRPDLVRYQPLEAQRAERARLAAAAAARAAEAREHTELEERLVRAVAAVLGGRAILGGGAAYAAFLLSRDNLLASFAAGLALQLASGALAAAALQRRGGGGGSGGASPSP